ncbi:hypothetical protein PIB30_029314 [Stylosanthes scabra]|uniref:Uncharacterized protein n=1 Tax=Stylosanthes scabra TaxID=79078 RepID=A0ABU6Y9T9_9FABA|nr:hypothetical protein [Stylosanthes scabra]
MLEVKNSTPLTGAPLRYRNHLDATKIPIQFEEISSSGEQDSASIAKSTPTDGATLTPVKKAASDSVKIIQESEKYTIWAQHDSVLQTWLDASMSITYRNKVVHCATFAETWELLNHIQTVSS